MTVLLIPISTKKYIGLSTDAKPTITTPNNLPPPTLGSTFYEYDTGELHITHNGEIWVLKGFSSGIQKISDTQAVAAAGNYGANDVLCSSASTGVAWNFANAVSANGRSGYITKAQITCETTAQAHRLTLIFFDAVPTSELRDNVTNTGPSDADRGNYLGKLDFNALESLGVGNSDVLMTPDKGGGIPFAFTCAAADRDLYGILVTRDAFTNETATDDYVITLSIEEA